jgi:hypothetical protein
MGCSVTKADMRNWADSTRSGVMTRVKTVEFVEAPQVPEIFANHVMPAITSFDVTLHFGTLVEIVDGKAKVAKRLSVVLTPEVAKVLHSTTFGGTR